MAIKLEIRSAQQLREDYVRLHQPVLRKLEKVLRTITDRHRSAYESLIAAQLIGVADNFIRTRKPNQTTYDFFNRRSITFLDTVNLVALLTDYEKASEAAYAAQQFGRVADFEVKFRTDASDLAAKEAKRRVEEIVRVFVWKVSDKLVELFVKRPDYTAEVIEGSYRTGTFTGNIWIRFPDNTGFKVRLQVKNNYSVLGTPYQQYPLTFHEGDFAHDFKAALSQEQLLDGYAVDRWKPPAAPKRGWNILKAGSVVLMKDGRTALVTGTSKWATGIVFKGGKPGHIKHPSNEAFCTEVKLITARIERRCRYTNGANEHYAFVCFPDETTIKLSPPAKKAAEVEAVKGAKPNQTRDALVLEWAFEALLAAGKI